jgi:hypothetical protein
MRAQIPVYVLIYCVWRGQDHDLLTCETCVIYTCNIHQSIEYQLLTVGKLTITYNLYNFINQYLTLHILEGS